MRVFIHVQTLLGIGHISRTACIARALVAAGAEVTVATGLDPSVPADFGGAARLALPVLRSADLAFSGLVDAAGGSATPELMAARQAQLLDGFAAFRPDALLIETYPFGRRALRHELSALLDAAWAMAPRPLIASSVRDILVERQKPERTAEMIATAQGRFDAVLVHGDPAFLPFSAAFPEAAQLAGRLHYTGYVTDPAPPATGTPEPLPPGCVLVSMGGGAMGAPLLEAVLALWAKGVSRPWRLLLGPDLPKAVAEAAIDRAAQLSGDVAIRPASRHFPQLLRQAALSVSLGGYNTVLDVLGSGTRALVVPFETPKETEQRQRTALLAERGLLHMLRQDALTPQSLAAAVADALAAPPPPPLPLDRNGAARTAALLADLAGQHSSRFARNGVL